MIKQFKLLMAILLVSCGATVFAQCIPMNDPGPPRYWDGVRGCYVPQGTPAVNTGTTTTNSVFGTIQPYGQQVFSPGFAQNNGFTNCQLVGGVVGATLGSLAKHHTAQAVILGAVGGGIAGNMYCVNTQGQRIVVQQAQQQWQQSVIQPPVQLVAQVQQALQKPTPKQIVAKLQMEIPNPPEGEYTCPFIADGEKLAVIKTIDQPSCVKWTDTVATAAGWKRN